MTALTLADVQEAAQRIAPHVRHTPLQPSPDLSALAGRTLLLKRPDYQEVPELVEALGLLEQEKFGKMIAFLEQPVSDPATRI